MNKYYGTREAVRYRFTIPGHAGGQGYEHPPQPPDSIVVKYELYIVDPSPLALEIRGAVPSYAVYTL